MKAALSSAEDEAQSVTSSYEAEATKLHILKEEETRLMETLAAVRGEIAQTTTKLHTLLDKASSTVETMKDHDDQLRRTTDQEEIYEFVCNKGAQVLSDRKDTIVQFLSNE